MEQIRSLGIWMDHSKANLMEDADHMNIQTIECSFTHESKTEALSHGENEMHTKEQHLQEAYYKKIGSVIMQYDRVLLFGPTEAKFELHNYLRAHPQFKHIHIEVMSADKMTENQEKAFVKNHFNKIPIPWVIS